MSNKFIPFNRPCFQGKELEYISNAVTSGQISGDGPFTRKCHTFLEKTIGINKSLLTTSCTHALEMAALLLDIQPGDEVILPSFTFVSTVNAFVLRGATPIFIDIRSDTLNLDESMIENRITPRTKAIVTMHYAGVGCEMDSILDTARKYHLAVVEDNAHGLFGKYKGKYLGSFGCLAAQSFHETKNFTCGEGGALLINNPQYITRAEVLREKGTNRSRFFRGEVNKYTWVDKGSSYLPSDILAAFLYAQFEAKDTIQTKRKKIWTTYYNRLKDWARNIDARLPIVPDHCIQPFHMFYIIMPSQEKRDALISHLKKHQILSVFHYLPLHTSKMGKRYIRELHCI